jgi:hypothetical protein
MRSAVGRHAGRERSTDPCRVEKLPDDCQPLQPLSRSSDVRTYREKVYLTSKHIGEALNELVAADPRYA